MTSNSRPGLLQSVMTAETEIVSIRTCGNFCAVLAHSKRDMVRASDSPPGQARVSVANEGGTLSEKKPGCDCHAFSPRLWPIHHRFCPKAGQIQALVRLR